MIEEEVVTYAATSATTITQFAMDDWDPARSGATGLSGNNVLAEMNGGGTLVTHYLWGDNVDQLIARFDAGGTLTADSAGIYFPVADQNGSIRDILNSSGTVIEAVNYDAFGNIIDQGSNIQYLGRYTYDTYDYDTATDFYFNHARVYDPTSGRWLSQDPLGYDAGDSNLYRYVNNRPTDATDPSGLFLSGVHVAITTKAIKQWASTKNLPANVLEYVTRTIVSANLAQDWGPSYDALEEHYTRPFNKNEMNAENQQKSLGEAYKLREMSGFLWEVKFQNYLKTTQGDFDALLNRSCNIGKVDSSAAFAQSALVLLGQLTHAWQDWYAHAVRLDQGGPSIKNEPTTMTFPGGFKATLPGNARTGFKGSGNSAWPGFIAFSDPTSPAFGGKINPASNYEGYPRYFIPCSYDFFAIAEHPSPGEPIELQAGPESLSWNTKDKEGTARALAAEAYTTKMLITPANIVRTPESPLMAQFSANNCYL